MDENEALAQRFEANRAYLTTVAYRMLGSTGQADDAVQEAWLRLNRSEADEIHNLRGWLTTVVARVCLDMLRSRKARREEPLPAGTPEEPIAMGEAGADPEYDAVLADSVGLALLVVLESLTPAERVAFVLHDMFDLPFDEVAPIVGRSPAASRQLASRARRRVRGAEVAEVDRSRKREIVDAFLAAARGGDFEALLAALDPDVVLRADSAAVQWSTASPGPGVPRLAQAIRGAEAVAQALSGTLRNAQPALVNGAPGLAWATYARPRAVVSFAVRRGKIVAINLVADPAAVSQLDVVVLAG
jgi:RNA polymerase sigma-70 factor (ECF subfamily)